MVGSKNRITARKEECLIRHPSMSLSMRIIPIIFMALWLNTSPAFAEYDDIYLECTYGGFKSVYSSPKIFKITRDGYIYDGPHKMELNRERIIDSYLFGSSIKNNKSTMYSIDIFSGIWNQYIITKDDIYRIRNNEEVTKNKVNSYAGLDWKQIGECNSVDKQF